VLRVGDSVVRWLAGRMGEWVMWMGGRVSGKRCEWSEARVVGSLVRVDVRGDVEQRACASGE
jgi:hypothetical protein